jgi:TetR/AcrR family transcriptional regulator
LRRERIHFAIRFNQTDKVTDQAIGPPARNTDRDGDTEKRILEAARSVFVRHGTAGARMQEIAAVAGVNQALLHYYFRSKERLAEAVFRDAAGRLVPAVVCLLGSDATLEQKLESFVHLYIDTVRTQPYLPGYVLAELHHQPDRLTALREITREMPPHEASRLMERLTADMKAAIREGRIRPMSPLQFIVNVVALCVFPFAARPMLDAAFGMNDERFEQFLDERRAELPSFILRALRP